LKQSLGQSVIHLPATTRPTRFQQIGNYR